ncbi:MAG: hypothetical protein QHH80_08490 [Anaerolineae bacterium]|nr:hypothetical protein [Anaerolineae bacterium]
MSKSKWTVRDWIYVAVFGALWGILEITLGSYLHVLFPPLADTFVVGLIMAGIGAIIALVGRWFVPKRGAVLAIGVVTTILKAFSLGGIVIGPMVAILAEAILMELALWLRAVPTRGLYILAGALAVSWNFFHKFIMMRILYGRSIVQVYTQMVKEGSKVLGIDVAYAVAIIVILFLFRVLVGSVAGWIGWDLGRLVGRRLARG